MDTEVVQTKINDESAWLYIKSEVGFGLKIRFYKQHLDMMITDHNGLTSEANGLMGKCILKMSLLTI